ncbi:MAG: hypothetical protein ACKV0T_08375 [Planctomycetales bacterium]
MWRPCDRWGLALAVAGVFAYYSRLPLHHTDLWGHLAYGRWIATQGSLPQTEPFMPLAHGVPLVDTAWLSQLVQYRVFAWAGPAGLQTLHGLTVAACCGLLLASIRAQTRQLWPAALALVSLLASEWFQFRIIRPQMAGVVCFAVLMFLVTTRAGRRRAVWLVPLVFALWANLHGSFVVGLGWMAVLAVGRMLDGAIRRRSWRVEWRDPHCRWLWQMIFLGGLATLCNPYGFRLYAEVLAFSGQANLRDLLEWKPLRWSSWQGRTFLATAMLLAGGAVVDRTGRRARSWLPLLLFGGATIWSARFLVWWGLLAAQNLALRLDSFKRLGWTDRAAGERALADSETLSVAAPASHAPDRHRRRFLGGLAVAAVFRALVACPLTQRLWTGKDPHWSVTLSAGTPVKSVAWLRAHPPGGLLLAPYEWGDYLLWSGPDDMQVFLTSHAHVVPRSVWRDYRRISRGEAAALELLREYQVQGVLIDRRWQGPLASRLAGDDGWKRVYADGQALVYVRQAEGTVSEAGRRNRDDR